MGRGRGGSAIHGKRTPTGIRTSSYMSMPGKPSAYYLPDGATLQDAKLYDQEEYDSQRNPIEPLDIHTAEDLVNEFQKGNLLVHARAKDGTDFEHGIDPSAGEFLRSTEAWQTAKENHNRDTELTFFADKDSDIARWAEYFAERSGKPIEMVFVRKDPSIVKSLGDGRVETADGQTLPYERSDVADYEDPVYRSLPAGVETGDWFTRKTQPVIGVVDYKPAKPEVKQGGWSRKPMNDDVDDALNYIEATNEKTVTLADDLPTLEYMKPEDFVEDVAWFESQEKGFLKNIPQGQWAEVLRDEYSREFAHIIEQYKNGQLSPGIMVDDDFGDGKGRAIFAWGLDEPVLVAKYKSKQAERETSVLQKEWEESHGEQWDAEEYGDFPTYTGDIVKKLAPDIIKAAQKEYDDWDEEDVDTYAGGGICHYIADHIADILGAKGIDAYTVTSNFEQHVYVVAQFADGVYAIDIPHQVYETGGGFSWQKIPDVEFSEGDVTLYRISSDPRDIKEHIED